MAARTHSCAATSAASSLGQQSWQAFVITTDPTSPRARRSAEILNASGIDVVLTRAVKPASNAFVDKVKSHTRTSRDVFESISSMHAPADEYVLVFEDDILLTPAVQPQPTVSPTEQDGPHGRADLGRRAGNSSCFVPLAEW